MLTDPLFFAVAIPAVIFAGISKGGFGSGASFAAAPLLTLVVDPQVALGVLLPVLMLIDLASLRPYWGKWSWSEARLLLIGSVPGVMAGVALLRIAPDDFLRALIGVIALSFVAWKLWESRVPRQKRDLPRWVGLLSGATAGLTSFVSHAGGPPIAIYLLSRGLSKTSYQGTTVLVFWIVNILKAVPYSMLGVFTAQTLWAGVWLAPAALLGTWLGVLAHRVMPERVFFGLTYVMLVLAGLKLLWDAST